MVKQQLALIGFKSSIYIAIIVFFVSCIIGYGSNLAIDTLIQKGSHSRLPDWFACFRFGTDADEICAGQSWYD